jgi:two-component system, cell cycle sensor histidine kinase and response regulator CckA
MPNLIRCVLTDLTMPRMNGWETLAALRKLSPGIPVILSSGYDEAKAMEGKHAELPQVFLHKPYRMAELKAALGAAMEESSAEAMKRDQALHRELQVRQAAERHPPGR